MTKHSSGFQPRERSLVSDQWSFLIAAYAITWAVLLSYAAYVARRWARARRALEGRDT